MTRDSLRSDVLSLGQETTIDADPHFIALIAAVRTNLDEIVPSVVGSFRAEIPAYAPIPDADLLPGVRSNVERALQALERGWQPAPEEIAASRALGEERAHQGVPLDALLRAHRIGVREVLAWIRQRAADRDVPAEVVLDTATRAWAWADAVMLSAASGHRDVELTLAGQERQQRAHLLRGLLAGAWADLERGGTAAAYGVVATQRYVLVQARGEADDVRRLETTLVQHAGEHLLLTAEVDRDLVVLLPSDGSVALPATLAPGLLLAVGDPAAPDRLARVHAVLGLVLDAAAALGRRGVVGLADVPLHAGVLSEPEIGQVLMERFVAPLEDAGEFGRQLLTTLPAWLEHGCRIDDAARSLYVHPNTMRHRIRRAQELLGADLQDTDIRFQLWWALTARQLSSRPAATQHPTR